MGIGENRVQGKIESWHLHFSFLLPEPFIQNRELMGCPDYLSE